MSAVQNKLRVLHVYRTYFPDPPGGLQEAIKQICLATMSHGVNSRIFVLSPEPSPERICSQEAEIFRSKSWCAPASCDIGGIGSLALFKEQSQWADVIHYHFPWPFSDLLRLLVNVKKPSVLTYHSDIVRQKLLNYLYAPLMALTFRSVNAVVATSPTYAKTSKVLSKNVSLNRLKIIPLGIVDYSGSIVDDALLSDVLSRFGLKGRPFLLSLGVLRYYKGLHTLIEAAKAINGVIVVAGMGPEEKNLRAQVILHKINNVIFVGQVSATEKVVLLASCRALVLPSHLRSEAFGMVLVEASMFSKPMICCEISSGTSYVNLDGETGYVVPPESPSDLAFACNKLLDDFETASQMGCNARKRYEQLFSGDALGLSYSKLYTECVQKKI